MENSTYLLGDVKSKYMYTSGIVRKYNSVGRGEIIENVSVPRKS